MKLSEFILAYRESHGLSQRQFAIQCGLSNGYISILEKGINPGTQKPVAPTLPQLKKLADGMGITLTALFENVDDMPVDIGLPGTIQSGPANLPLSPESQKIAAAYDKATAKEQQLVRLTLSDYL